MTLRDAVAGASVVVVSVILAACGGSATAARPINDTGVCSGQTGVSTATSQKYVVVLVATTQVVPGFASSSASPSPTPPPPAVLSGTEAAINGPGARISSCTSATGRRAPW